MLAASTMTIRAVVPVKCLSLPRTIGDIFIPPDSESVQTKTPLLLNFFSNKERSHFISPQRDSKARFSFMFHFLLTPKCTTFEDNLR